MIVASFLKLLSMHPYIVYLGQLYSPPLLCRPHFCFIRSVQRIIAFISTVEHLVIYTMIIIILQVIFEIPGVLFLGDSFQITGTLIAYLHDISIEDIIQI